MVKKNIFTEIKLFFELPSSAKMHKLKIKQISACFKFIILVDFSTNPKLQVSLEFDSFRITL
jgi:hypothetical protein